MVAGVKGSAGGGPGERFSATTFEHEHLLRQFLVRRSSFAQHDDKFQVIHPVQDGAADWVIPANSKALGRFKSVVALLVYWDFVCIPFLVAFGHRMPAFLFHPAWKFFEYSLDLVHVAYICVCLCSGYIDANARIEVRNPVAIRQNYLHSKWFVFDAVSVFPAELLALAIPSDAPIENWSNGDFHFSVSAFYLLKFMTRVFKSAFFVRRYLHRYSTSISTEPPGAKQLCKIFALFLLMTHVFGCYWLALEEHVLVRDRTGPSWQDAFHVDYQTDIPFSYTASLFAGMMVMIDQDLLGFLSSEQFIGVFVMLSSAYMHAYLFGNVEMIMERIMARNVRLHERLDEATSAMAEMGLNTDVQFRVRQYFIYCHDMKHERGYQHVIDELSGPLQTEIRLLLHSSLIQRTWLFDGVAAPILRDVVLQLVSETYLPGDYIVAYGDRGVCMYFVVSGACEVINSREDRLTVLTSGAYFGEVALLRNGLRTASVRALTWTTVAKLDKSALTFIINTYPEYAKRLNDGFANYMDDLDGADSPANRTNTQHPPSVSLKLLRVTGREVANKKLRKTMAVNSFVTRLAHKTQTPRPLSKCVGVPSVEPEALSLSPAGPSRPSSIFRNNKVAPLPPLLPTGSTTVERTSKESSNSSSKQSEDDVRSANGLKPPGKGGSFRDMSILPLDDAAYLHTTIDHSLKDDEPCTPVQNEPAPEDPATESSDPSDSEDDGTPNLPHVTRAAPLPFPLLCQPAAGVQQNDLDGESIQPKHQRKSNLLIRGRSLEEEIEMGSAPQIRCESLAEVFDQTYRFFDGEGRGPVAEVSIGELTPKLASAEREGQQARADLLQKLTSPHSNQGFDAVMSQAKRLYRQQSMQSRRQAMHSAPWSLESRRGSLESDRHILNAQYPSSAASSPTNKCSPTNNVAQTTHNRHNEAGSVGLVLPPLKASGASNQSRQAQQFHVLKILETQRLQFHGMQTSLQSLQHRCNALEAKFIRIVSLLPV
eukprot:GILJ01004954.1.p1 GENE.GILJ01004954.1~~GILJ01004954.1.p1  ORF type:complete len:992 (+),score=144.03 GILJ01004954.1:69-3044(+)